MASKTVRLLGTFFVAVALLPASVLAADLIPNVNDSNGSYVSVQAQPCGSKVDPAHPSASQPGNASCTVNRIVNRFLSDLFYLMGAVAVLLLIYSGILYIQANGNAEATKKARQNIVNILLGILLLTTSYTIIELLKGTAAYFKP